jgi:hypothetical protein
MSKELDELSKQYQKEKPTVIRKEISIFQSSLQTEAANFLRSVEMECKKQKQANMTLVVIIPEVYTSNLIR